MSYIDSLIELKDEVSSSDFKPNQKILLINLIEREKLIQTANEEPFVFFYTNVLKRDSVFDFSSIGMNYYGLAKEHASTCINTFNDFSALEEDHRLHTWLQSAIRLVDCIVIHYIQEMLGEPLQNFKDIGAERSRFRQITRRGLKAESAGRIMENLYVLRNKMEHITKRDPDDPEKRILVPPKLNMVKRKIQKQFPVALERFDDAFTEHYS